jgi:hypothetical protein
MTANWKAWLAANRTHPRDLARLIDSLACVIGGLTLPSKNVSRG